MNTATNDIPDWKGSAELAPAPVRQRFAPAWLMNEIADGLSALVALRLDGGPAHDSAVMTAKTWAVAFMAQPRLWDCQRDAPRVRAAFATLAGQVTRWPTPRQLLDALPPVPPPLMIERDPITPTPVGLAALEHMRSRLGPPPSPPTVDTATGPDDLDAEEETHG
jgi:hypothetical protein